MKNLFGEEFDPKRYELHFEWNEPHLTIVQGEPFTNDQGIERCKTYCGTISPNGWQGDHFSLQYALGEPIFNNLGAISQMSLVQMQNIVFAYNKHMPPVRAMQYVISRIADWKHISFDEAIAYVKEKGYRTIA